MYNFVYISRQFYPILQDFVPIQADLQTERPTDIESKYFHAQFYCFSADEATFLFEPLAVLKMKYYHQWIDTMVVVTLPLISGLYGLQRYIIICCPHLISKYCTVKTTIISVAIIIVVGSILSFHEVFDEYMYYNGVSASLLATNHQKHENFTGVVVIIVLLIISVTVSVLHAIVTEVESPSSSGSISSDFLRKDETAMWAYENDCFSN